MRGLVLLALLAVLAGCLAGGEELDDRLEPADAGDEAGNGTRESPEAAGDDDGGTEPSAAASRAEAGGNASVGDANETDDANETTGTAVEPVSVEPPDPHVTVAVVDTGANLYHSAFQAREGWAGAPANATRVNLTLGVDDWRSAVEADWSRLSGLESERLYRFPGTRFSAAISFLEPDGCLSPAEQACRRSLSWPRFLDDPANGTPHGTRTASRVVGPGMGVATDPDVRLVLVQVDLNATSIERGIAWAGERDWIDAVSLSLGPPAGPTDRSHLGTLDEASHRKPVFVAAGNGLANAGLAPKPNWAWDGTPDAIAVGGVDNDRLTHWSDQDPYVAADACNAPLARANRTAGAREDLGGTSFSAPYVAGVGAELILHARELLGDDHVGVRVNDSRQAPSGAWSSGRPGDAAVVLARGGAGSIAAGPLADGDLTLRELKDVLYHTARPTPTVHPHDGARCPRDVVPVEAVPERARFPYVGYGEVTPGTLELAETVLEGNAELPSRPQADEQYRRAHALRALAARGELPAGPEPPTP